MIESRFAVGALALLTATLGLAPLASAQTPDGLTATEWTSLREAYEHGRHRVFATDDGQHQTRTPRQQYATRFDGRGALVRPDEGDWTFGLELVSYGFDGSEIEVTTPVRTEVDRCRISYAWDDTVTEWYVNGDDGLEHGFTVRERPEGADSGAGDLRFDLRVIGGLDARVDADGLGAALFDASGTFVATYAGLSTVDHTGRELASWMTSSPDGLTLHVDDTGARYPLTIDPVVQQAYVKASNTDASDQFGYSVAISGDTVVVGAYGEDSNATGVDGNQANNGSSQSGAAYVFVRSGATWAQQAYLKASNTDINDQFGFSVAVSGDTVVVGAWREASTATGVDGDQSSNLAGFSGAAYVFVRSGTTWTQQAYLKASNTDALDEFGKSVSISGDTVVVGAAQERSNAAGIDGNQADNSTSSSGAAYVFVRTGTTWAQQAYLKASNSNQGDQFGTSVAIDGDTVVAGAIWEDSGSAGVGGDETDSSASNSGAAYIFERSGSTWSQQAYLKASNTDANDQFGWSVGLSGDTAVVGAWLEDSAASGVDGDQLDNSSSNAGAAYVFARSGSTWSQQSYLKASNTDGGDSFGTSVAVSGDIVVVGANLEDSLATGIDGNQADNGAFAAGAAYVFLRAGSTWSQQAYLKGSNTEEVDYFGTSVALSGDTLAVGAVSEASSAVGVDGDQSDDSASGAGATYIFDLGLDPDWLAFPGCSGITASLSTPTGPLKGGQPTSTDVSSTVAPNGAAAIYYGALGVDGSGCGTLLPDGNELLLALVPFPSFYKLAFLSSGSATVSLQFPPNPALVGLRVAFQAAVIDPLTFASEVTTAIEGVVRP
ncbi:hypothetical protein Pla163_02710 [Planctomycetes bacterium Pla163]|uniref:FG-GAP repeat protein n=1 Tax=Rohdeia mirabilis TaxID=2528008 RepID=A0A518CVD8_9BACT|nr:hypothetical protein Pla163_02710 [Planctomycetes bacterium Pla163]